MRQLILKSLFILLGICSLGSAQNANIVTIEPGSHNEIVITIDPQIHIDYGVAYPLTYEFSIPEDIYDLIAYKKYSSYEEWTQLEEKTSEEFYNALEMVRFEYDSNKAFLSAGFTSSTDTLFVKITNNSGQNTQISFNQICKYYDKRVATVICSSDDYADWNRGNFLKTIHNFRSLHLWLSVGIISSRCSQESFVLLQQELDAGYIEASAHSRTHPQGPYVDPVGEITGCKEDLTNSLDMPFLFRNGDHEYVYLWIGPYGYNDTTVESLLGQNKFLANRLYYDSIGTSGFPEWDEQYELYQAFGVTRELGPVREYFIGSGDSTDLNNAFDEVVSNGGVYHVMCHPSIVEWDEAYTWSHLNHISNLNNIWYASVGQAFVYHFAQENYQHITTSVADNKPINSIDFALSQNYPNPFNPVTCIEYSLPVAGKVQLTVYDLSGKKVAELLNEKQAAGFHRVIWDASHHSGIASGVYLYRLWAGEYTQVCKMLLVK